MCILKVGKEHVSCSPDLDFQRRRYYERVNARAGYKPKKHEADRNTDIAAVMAIHFGDLSPRQTRWGEKLSTLHPKRLQAIPDPEMAQHNAQQHNRDIQLELHANFSGYSSPCHGTLSGDANSGPTTGCDVRDDDEFSAYFDFLSNDSVDITHTFVCDRGGEWETDPRNKFANAVATHR